MANVAALKKKAADFEAKKQMDKAIAAYREVLDAFDSGGEENIDVSLYNRVGDMLVRQGNTPEAVTLYERAVDLYAEGGYFNNAIALCNKILRTSPGRATVYYKLGKISAAKGFKADAKQNFLEYADRMQKSGQINEAFRALKEFADLCPDQDDIRQMLAEQLTKADRKSEALEQLQLLYARYDAEGREAEATATVERMKAIDPNAEAKASAAGAKTKSSDDLIFIDLDAPMGRKTRRTAAITSIPELPPPKPASAPPPPPAPPAEQVLGMEHTSHVEAEAPAASANVAMPGLELTSFGVEPEMEPAPLEVAEFDEIDLSAIAEAPAPPPAENNLALAGELPMLDLDERVSGELTMIDVEPTAAAHEVTFIDLGTSESGEDHAMLVIDTDDEPVVPVEELVAAAPDTPTSFDAVSIEVADEPPTVRRTSSMLANSVPILRVRLEDDPENWALHRQYAEALLDDGERDEGLRELEAALVGFEKTGDLEGARSVADEVIRLNPGSVRHHQKRVEYAFRSNDKVRLAEAYVELADALFRDGQAEKAKVVYQRVLEIAPDDLRAQAAIESYGGTPAVAAEPVRESSESLKGRRYTAAIDAEQLAAAHPEITKASDSDDEFVSLGDWLRADEGPKSTRMVVDEEAPSGDEEADFKDMLKKFKQGVAENVSEEDHESHYDLGVAFKEMGLMDEAISEFQKALRGTQQRVRTYEALGQCFLEKKQLPVAQTILHRAVNEPGVGDEQLVGVLYLLGYVNEALGKPAEAKGFYERVFSVDIQFRDVGDRLNAVDKAMK